MALSCTSPFLSCRLKLVLLGISGKPEPPYRDHCLGTERLSYPMPADNDFSVLQAFVNSSKKDRLCNSFGCYTSYLPPLPLQSTMAVVVRRRIARIWGGGEEASSILVDLISIKKVTYFTRLAF